MKSHAKLVVWQKGMDLVEHVYRITSTFPEEEKFGLISQLRRCSVSIPSNIAEGNARDSDRDFCKFLRIAFGSSAELETQLEIAHRLQFLEMGEYEELLSALTEIRKMLNTLISNKLTANKL